MTPTDNPYRALELMQLVHDLGRSGLSAPYTRAGLEMLAEALYERGVRSRLHAPYRDNELIQFTWDPEIRGFEITETGVYELVMEAIDVPDIEPFPTFPRAEMPRMLHRLRRKAGLRPVLTQMSEVPGHVTRQVPGPIPERKLPEGVYNVIHFVQLLDLGRTGAGARNWATHIADGRGGDRRITDEDLRAVLAEIPDVAPRYPTIWAYEQACRTIRERDERIERALELLGKFFTKTRPIGPDPDDVMALKQTLRLRMPRTLPASEKYTSEVTRALELITSTNTTNDPVPLEALVKASQILAAEVEHLWTLGDTLDADLTAVVVTDETGDIVPCGTCSALEPPVSKPAVGRSERGWPRCAQHLVADALDDADKAYTPPARCPSCHHLSSSHYEDGSGCSVTIRDVGLGADNHCPCSFDARSVHRG